MDVVFFAMEKQTNKSCPLPPWLKWHAPGWLPAHHLTVRSFCPHKVAEGLEGLLGLQAAKGEAGLACSVLKKKNWPFLRAFWRCLCFFSPFFSRVLEQIHIDELIQR